MASTETNTPNPNAQTTASNVATKMTGYFNDLKQNIPTGLTSKVNYGVERARSIASEVSTDIQQSASNNNVNSPLPSDYETETQKAAKILSSFTDPEKVEGGLENVIPKDVFANAKGLAIFTVVKAGFFWSGRVGSGLVIAK
jgi:hypothetical protein